MLPQIADTNDRFPTTFIAATQRQMIRYHFVSSHSLHKYGFIIVCYVYILRGILPHDKLQDFARLKMLETFLWQRECTSNQRSQSQRQTKHEFITDLNFMTSFKMLGASIVICKRASLIVVQFYYHT